MPYWLCIAAVSRNHHPLSTDSMGGGTPPDFTPWHGGGNVLILFAGPSAWQGIIVGGGLRPPHLPVKASPGGLRPPGPPHWRIRARLMCILIRLTDIWIRLMPEKQGGSMPRGQYGKGPVRQGAGLIGEGACRQGGSMARGHYG